MKRPVPLLLTLVSLSLSAGAAPARPLEGLTAAQRRDFEKGEKLFQMEWSAAPGKRGTRDGLGPFYHAASCVACHPGGGRGLSPDATDPGQTLVFRIGSGDESMLDDYGAQLSPLAIPGVKPEGSVAIAWTERPGAFPDGTPWTLRMPAYTARHWEYGTPPAGLNLSPRLAPALFGSGLLEAVAPETLAALADPDDKNGDGISGRLNREDTWEGYNAGVAVAGRFGWKAWMPTLLRQVCGALCEDMGVTTILQPQDLTPAESEALENNYTRGGHGALFEAGGHDTELLTAYVRYLAPPERRESKDPAAGLGRALFTSAGCAACHVPELKTSTGPGDLKALEAVVIHPFSDLLLHDMGPDLADGRPEAEAHGNEWRTAPLWGLAAALDDKGAGLLLHDGRARSLEEAILWHGGEGTKSRQAFVSLPVVDRKALLAFLKTL